MLEATSKAAVDPICRLLLWLRWCERNRRNGELLQSSPVDFLVSVWVPSSDVFVDTGDAKAKLSGISSLVAPFKLVDRA